MEASSPREKVAQLPPLGVSPALGTGTPRKFGYPVSQHVVKRSSGKTLCGRVPTTLYAVDLKSRDQVTCGRCYKLAFTSVNACASSTPMERV